MRIYLISLFLVAAFALVACGGGDSSSSNSSTATPIALAGCMKAVGGPSIACLSAMEATTTEKDCNALGACSYTKSDGSFVYARALSSCAAQKDITTGKPSSSENCNGAIGAATTTEACNGLGANSPAGHYVSVTSSDKTLQNKMKCAIVRAPATAN